MKYSAFISYNHRDQKHARWLHKALEAYRIPKNLRGREGRNGPIGAKLEPVFRDRDELAAAANLGEAVQEALGQADSLIVICSPNGAKSKWVNAEIREFARQGRRHRVFCLIVGGEPNAADPENECLPPALFDDGASEPLAADIRPLQDSKTDAKIKLIASVMDLGYDELRQREQARRVRQLTMIAMAASVAVVITSGLAITAYLARNEAIRQRDIARDRTVTAERTVEFVKGMFTVSDPSEALGNTITAREVVDRGARDFAVALKNEPVVKAEIGLTLSEVYGALGLYREADRLVRSTTSLPPEERGTLARKHMLQGESQFRLGEYEAAIVTFKRSVALARVDDNARETILGRALVGLGQSYSAIDEFDRAKAVLSEALALYKLRGTAGRRDQALAYETLGLNQFYAGDFAKARSFLEHANTLRLATEGQNSPSVSDNYGNLATIAYLEGDTAKAERLYRSRLAIDEKVLGRDHPDVATTLNNISRIMIERRSFAEAEPLLDRAVQSVRRERGAMHDDMAFMLSNLALARKGLGKRESAVQLLREALIAARANQHRTLAPILVELADLACSAGDTSKGATYLTEARKVMAADYPDDAWRKAWIDNVAAVCAWRGGDRDKARNLFNASKGALGKRWAPSSLYGVDMRQRAGILGMN